MRGDDVAELAAPDFTFASKVRDVYTTNRGDYLMSARPANAEQTNQQDGA